MCKAILKATDVIKKSRVELNADPTSDNGGSGQDLARGPPTEPMQALYQAELEDMCQEDDVWHWQEDLEASTSVVGSARFPDTGAGKGQDWKVEEWETWTGPHDAVCDSTTGKPLDVRKVKVGRNEELEWMRKMHVWDRVPRHEAAQGGHKIVGTRWVYVDKGDQVRCRLVAQEFAGSEKREDLYAGTPPLSATRYLLSNTASRGRSYGVPPSRKLMVLDIKRAFLHGQVTRTIHVELPEEESEGGRYVGRLVKTLYGTRDAPVAWQRVVKSDMARLGFDECRMTTGVYIHRDRDLRVVTHVDDFLVAGEAQHLKWLRDELGKTYELKVQIAGWQPGDAREVSFLGRTIRLSNTGIEIEGDDKHVKGLIEEWQMQECKPVSTPYDKSSNADDGSNAERPPMSPKDTTLFRRAAARLNYVALDRPDLSFSSRVAAGKMSKPLEGDDVLIKRVIRYLQGKPRVSLFYGFQEPDPDIVVMTDSDWGGDRITRRSTSGGVVLNGTHTILWWCKLQSTIALSSCEAELNASLKGAKEGLCAQGIAQYFGDDLNLELKTDASAARGVIMRQGVGQIRHLHIKHFWLQEKVLRGDLIITKIPRSENWSDALTHPWTAADLPFWDAMGLRFIPPPIQAPHWTAREA